MVERFAKFIVQNHLVDKNRKLLLAVSGGVDSVVMTHLFHKAGFHCGIAHCNFQLRGEHSDLDESFVKTLAEHSHFPFYSIRFNTLQFANDNKLSIQMAARQLRYAWFDELMHSHGYEMVATAHHADDVAETILLNLVRGTGLSGLHGIPVQNGKVIRPLLFATKNEIEIYATGNNLSWRTDATNQETDYTRNKIRHQVLPLLKEINPKVIESFYRHSNLIKKYEAITEKYFAEVSGKLLKTYWNGALNIISIDELMKFADPEFVLYHLVGKFGFSASAVSEVVASKRVGAEFHALGYRMYREREYISICEEKVVLDDRAYVISDSLKELQLQPGVLKMEMITFPEENSWRKEADWRSSQIAYINGDKVKFPLEIRRWKEGDEFQPLGMKGKKLISDFCTDEKLSSVEKETLYLLLSGGEVVWVVGYRIDERFKMEDQSKHALKFTYNDYNIQL